MRQAKQGGAVRVHYGGKLQDGCVFDVSFDREPLQFGARRLTERYISLRG